MGKGKGRNRRNPWKRTSPINTRATAKNDSSPSGTNDTSAVNAQNQTGGGVSSPSISGTKPQKETGPPKKKFRGAGQNSGASDTNPTATEETVETPKKVKKPKTINSDLGQKKKKSSDGQKAKKRKHENAFSPLNPKFIKKLKKSAVSSLSDKEQSEEEEQQKEEVEETSEEATPRQSERTEALKVRGKIAQNVFKIRDIISHVDSLESNDVDPSSFLVEAQFILNDIVQETAELIDLYDQKITIYEEFSFEHSKEVRQLLNNIRFFARASYGNLYEAWHQARQDLQFVMDIDMNLAYHNPNPVVSKPEKMQEEPEPEKEKNSRKRNLTDAFNKMQITSSDSEDESICGTKRSKRSKTEPLLKGSTLTDTEKKALYKGCKPETALKIEEAGTGPKLKLTGSIFADYVQKEVFISNVKFSGEPNSNYGLHHVMSHLKAIHVANNISYPRKMLALSLGLTGKAHSAISAFLIETTELKYKQALCKLYKLYGDDSLHQATILDVLERETLPTTNLDVQVEYLSRAETTIEQLLNSGENPEIVYSNACRAIFRLMPDRIDESRYTRVAKCGYLISDRAYFKQDYEGRFKEFVDWMYSKRTNEAELHGTSGLENQESSVNTAKNDEVAQRLETLEKKEKQNIILQNALRNKIKELEAQRAPAAARSAESQPGSRSPGPRKNRGQKRSDFPKRTCPFCGSDEHTMYNCKLTIDERRQVVEDKHLCPVCLRPNHSKKDCRSPIKCQACFDDYGNMQQSRHSPGTCKNNAKKWQLKIETQKALREAKKSKKENEPEEAKLVEAAEEKPPEQSSTIPPVNNGG